MEIQIIKHGLNVQPKQEDYLEEKITRVLRAGGNLDEETTQIKADLRRLKIKTEENIGTEITIFTKGAVIRAEEKALTLEAAIDLATEKLQKQLRRYKERYKKRRREERWIPQVELPEDMPQDDEPKIVKRKRFSNNKPMHEEEAIELMELSGHDFFLFNNVHTGRWSVVYKRRDGAYAVLEPKVGNEE